MDEQNNKVQKNQDNFSKGLEEISTSRRATWKRWLSKRWVFPAMYMAVAAIILTIMWVYQNSDNQLLSMNDPSQGVTQPANPENVQTGPADALPVTVAPETMSWPVQVGNGLEVVRPYYDAQGTNEVKQTAMVEYGDTLFPNVGVDFSSKKDDKPFPVAAAMSGKVTRIENNPVVGHQVEISHDGGLVTVYQSLSEIKVTQNAAVKKGDIIGQSGRNELEKDLGNHLHFEVRQDGKPVNPNNFIAKN